MLTVSRRIEKAKDTRIKNKIYPEILTTKNPLPRRPKKHGWRIMKL
jgi:hypothetical protein